MIKKLLCFGLILIFSIPAVAQDLDTAWVRFYDGLDNRQDVATALAVDDYGNVFVTGATEDYNNKENYLTIKYTSDGDIAWLSEFDGPESGIDYPVDIALDKEGDIIVTGSSYNGPDDFDIVTIKYLPDGDTAWVRRYDYPDASSSDWARALAIDKNGAVIVTGSIKSGKALLTLKYGADGTLDWTRFHTLYIHGINMGYDVAVDKKGFIFVTGCRASSPTDIDLVTLKYNPDGHTLWASSYNGPGNYYDWAEAVVVDDAGSAYVTGASEGDGTGMDYVTIKYDPDGDSEWVQRYAADGNNFPDKACDLALDNWDNVFVTGYSRGNATGFDFLTIKYNSDGDTIWTRRYNGPDSSTDWACDIEIDRFDNIVVGGESYSSLTFADFTVVMYDSDGNQRCLKTFNGTGNGEDDLVAIAVDDDGNVYATGLSDGIDSDCDFATIKYSPVLTDVDERISGELPENYTLSQNYPNPFNPATFIEYKVASRSYINLAVYNTLGQKIRTLVDGTRSVGTYKAVWDGTDQNGKAVATGIYFYLLETDETTESRKMLLLR